MKHSKRLISTSAQIILRQKYETAFGIYDHEGPDGEHPLALVMHNWSEDNVSYGRLRERMEAFAEHSTGKWFNTSFKEFIDMPTYVCDMMLEIAENMQNRLESSVNSEELRRLAKEAERKATEGK